MEAATSAALLELAAPDAGAAAKSTAAVALPAALRKRPLPTLPVCVIECIALVCFFLRPDPGCAGGQGGKAVQGPVMQAGGSSLE